MASIEFINKRIEGKEKEIAKLQKKADRIAKAKATNWEVNPYYYDEMDERSTAKELARAIEALNDYREALKVETEKAASRDVAAIIEFLENWKQHLRDYYGRQFEKYPEAKEEYYRQDRAYIDWFQKNFKLRRTEEYEAKRKEEKAMHALFQMEWGFIEPYIDRKYKDGERTYIFDTEKFEKDIKREAERKYDDMIERVNKITGTITDAGQLKVGDKGDLNGYIIGENGIAKLTTIGAGGYNIQCFHFRTLVHKVK